MPDVRLIVTDRNDEVVKDVIVDQGEWRSVVTGLGLGSWSVGLAEAPDKSELTDA